MSYTNKQVRITHYTERHDKRRINSAIEEIKDIRVFPLADSK